MHLTREELLAALNERDAVIVGLLAQLEALKRRVGTDPPNSSMPPGSDGVPAENAIRAAQAACSYSRSMPPRRSRRRMFSRVRWSGSVIGSGSGTSGLALAMPWCGRCSLLRHESRTL
jgi:hypothetical protein